MSETPTGTAAGWYDDPGKTAERRYFDGTQWTEHVVVSSFTLSRAAQWRTEDEKPLTVAGTAGLIGSFAAIVAGVPGYRFEDVDGDVVVTVVKPSLKASVEVQDPAGYAVGTIARVGRLHSRYDIVAAESGRTASARLLSGATDAWDVHMDGAVRASITRTTTSSPDGLMLGGADYAVSLRERFDDEMERLLLALPLAIDVLDTQTHATGPAPTPG